MFQAGRNCINRGSESTANRETARLEKREEGKLRHEVGSLGRRHTAAYTGAGTTNTEKSGSRTLALFRLKFCQVSGKRIRVQRHTNIEITEEYRKELAIKLTGMLHEQFLRFGKLFSYISHLGNES